MQKANRALVRVTTAIVALLLVRSANAEVSLGEMTRKCLQLENFWTLKSTQDTTGSIPNDGSSVCFGYDSQAAPVSAYQCGPGGQQKSLNKSVE